MVRVSEKFISSFLNNKLMGAIKPLNEVKDAIDSSEEELRAEVDGIIQKILSIEI